MAAHGGATMTSNRRELLKKSAAGAGAVGVAWAAPRVEGLSLRPDYAAAQSGPICANYAVTMNFRQTGNSAGYVADGTVSHPDAGVVNIGAATATFNSTNLTIDRAYLGFGDRAAGPPVLGNCRVNIDAVTPVGLTSALISATGDSFIFRSLKFPTIDFANRSVDAITVSGMLCCD